ncbi:hypothetical protein BROUX41_001236 [Berkeleyomyces rouxiae]
MNSSSTEGRSGAPSVVKQQVDAQEPSLGDQPHLEPSFEDDHDDNRHVTQSRPATVAREARRGSHTHTLDSGQNEATWDDVGLLESLPSDVDTGEVGLEDGSLASFTQAPSRGPDPSADARPEDAASIQGSVLSSPGSSVIPSIAINPSDANSPARGLASQSFRPFDRRFSSRIVSASSSMPSRPSSPATMLAHGRNASVTSQFIFDRLGGQSESAPWEVVRWTRLNKLAGIAFSEMGRRSFGSPTCLAVASSIFVGTSKGLILMFDYSQNLKTVIGPSTKAVECGAVTCIAVSTDHSTVAGGHTNGSIFTWETSRPTRAFLSIPPLQALNNAERTSDGHLIDSAVIHLGFLGTRRTALVSADNRGMAFSHLATRGTGALGRTVKTNRILGRYPDTPQPSTDRPLKPSTVLAFAPLPLGNIERATDTMGLTAMLTPYLLVIVSTTPVAQTQHKVARPKNIQPHSTMSGCLAWFPAGKLKAADVVSGDDISKAKLVYCWSNILTVLDVDEIPADNSNKPPGLEFRARNRWKCEEAIVAVQWLSRSVITVLTVTQRLMVIEDYSMRVTDSFDLLHKSIYHADLFSRQLHSLVEQFDAHEHEAGVSMHGTVADAFYMSLKVFKGRLFLLGVEDLSIGALSNWYDRLIALMTNGDYVESMKLAISYYVGHSDKVTVGLPEDDSIRHSMIFTKIFDLITECLTRISTSRRKDHSSVSVSTLKELVDLLFQACTTFENIDFLFDTVYEWYEENNFQGLFLETLETHIVAETIVVIPPTVMKSLVSYYVEKGLETRLEEMICHVQPSTLDLDQITLLCKQHGLYDALIYVWNTGLGDYITPLIDLLDLLIIPSSGKGSLMKSGAGMGDGLHGINAVKIFPYLSYKLTGRVYPTGEYFDDKIATQAKSEIYWFLFSGNSVEWPRGSKRRFITCPDRAQEPSFPYLRLILRFDAPSFLSAMNEAFEDSFLNDSPEKQIGANIGGDVPEEQVFGLTVDRQYIVSILLELMGSSEFSSNDMIYLDMFIARNLPKFQQYLIFPGSTLTKVLMDLCRYPGENLTEDAQLSAEYLLSVYHPPDMDTIMPLLKEARFYRILKRIHLSNREYEQLIRIYFEDPHNQAAIFDCLADCLRTAKGLGQKQRTSLFDAISNNALDLIRLDAAKAANAFSAQDISLHRQILDAALDLPNTQYLYLETLLEPNTDTDAINQSLKSDQDLVELYVRLMCDFNPSHVANYISLSHVPDLRLNQLLDTLEETGVVDAAVMLMAGQGLIKDAMGRLIRHLKTLEATFCQILTKPEDTSSHLQSSAEDLLQSLQKFTHVGIWLCKLQQEQQGVTSQPSWDAASGPRRRSMLRNERLSETELLWLTLIQISVQMTKSLSVDIEDCTAPSSDLDKEKLTMAVRTLVQHVFTALLTATSGLNLGGEKGHAVESNVTFLRILRAFLTDAAVSLPNLADLRSVLSSIFAAYTYEESILQLSNRLLNQNLFLGVSQSIQLKQRGWRPRGSTCEACGRRLWGPGVPGNIYRAWETKQLRDDEYRREVRAQAREPSDSRGKSKALSRPERNQNDAEHAEWPTTLTSQERARETVEADSGNATQQNSQQDNSQLLDDIVLLACRHIYHRKCLDRQLQGQSIRCLKQH